MVNGIDSTASYRSLSTLGATTRESTSTEETEETGSTGQVWNAVFTDESENTVSLNDFLTLMVAQLQNQDFMDPVDDTQYVTQLAQFATMQQMQEMATYMKTNYVLSLVGKEVTAAKFSVSGELQQETGRVEKISLVNNEYAVYVNGKKFTLQQIMEIGSSSDSSSDTTTEPSVSDEYLTSMLGREVTVQKYNEDDEPDGKVTGTVDRISTEDGKYQVQIDGTWYPAENVVEIAGAAQSEAAEEEAPQDGNTDAQTVSL